MEQISGVLEFKAEKDAIKIKISEADVIAMMAKYQGKKIIITLEEA